MTDSQRPDASYAAGKEARTNSDAAQDVRKGQVTEKMPRDVFRQRFRARFHDPAYRNEDDAIERLEAIAWDAYHEGRKAPVTEKAGPGAADPDYDLSVEWRQSRDAIRAAQREHDDAGGPSRVLLVVGAARNDYTCPGEMSKSWRLAGIARARMEALGMTVDTLDLSLLASDHDLRIHPCKGCVSTSMPLCHWPCSCYPNHSLGQVNDWMADIYPRWVRAHGVLIVTPTYWYQVSSPLKLMMDRLVCADGGNPDPSSTHGKKVPEAKALELQGWDYPKHLAGRVFGVVVHGDVAGIEGVRRSLGDWLNWMGLVQAGPQAQLDRFIGYYSPYATSHRDLDEDVGVQKEVENAGAALAQAVTLRRQGKLPAVGDDLKPPRPK
ncbi:flavodoxin family protein [Cupriavidus sp. EM10]|uniref:flavodoxin family protein n=2 Tax=unclassified Cupriavidus TaxID=2640874 RepID=UPI001C005FEB|nr:flavodoxin family protein [Cupriavidus sp.]QWE97427.1 flavodoxin family protein [Cupriavidus sp. EM10]MCA3188785.1 flavodoxin family protein [Cupriavidus sp.]MCA3198505.1 flavodoxin family protein [Cupriavidus sp.]MCA3201251.1 flavodoxin family protein [Cupriavidus sp.]